VDVNRYGSVLSVRFILYFKYHFIIIFYVMRLIK
jgi:hypothetical protein